MIETTNAPRPAAKTRWSWRKRLGFGALTVGLMVVAVECGLRVVSAALGDQTDERGNADDDCAAVVFLALGDSMTFGIGATRDRSYPAEFSIAFEERYPDVPVKLYNLGLPGSNTSEGIIRLDEFFAENPGAAPDFAFILYGVNNRWNLHQGTFWSFDGAERKKHIAAYLASSFKISKAVSIAAQGGAEAAARLREDYGAILERTNWDVFFPSFDDELLSRWIRADFAALSARLLARGIRPIFLSYFSARFPELNTLLRNAAKAASQPFVELERPAEYYALRRMFSHDDFHMNATGYKDVAARLLDDFSRRYDAAALRALAADKGSSPACRAASQAR